MEYTRTQCYGFDSKREAQKDKQVGTKVWDAEIPDHRNPESLLVVVSNGPVEYNASGPTYWSKEVTYRRATREAASGAIAAGDRTIESIAAETGWPVMDGCLVPESEVWHADDGIAEITIHCETGERAAQQYADGTEPVDPYRTSWVNITVWRQGIDDDGDIVRIDEAKHKFTVEPVEPKCVDGEEHDWQNPLEIVGGIPENPGVEANFGGVTIQHVCMRCGCGRLVNTWDEDPTDAVRPLRSVTYEPRKYMVKQHEVA